MDDKKNFAKDRLNIAAGKVMMENIATAKRNV